MTIFPVLYCFVLCYYAGPAAARVKVEGEKGSNVAAGVVYTALSGLYTPLSCSLFVKSSPIQTLLSCLSIVITGFSN